MNDSISEGNEYFRAGVTGLLANVVSKGGGFIGVFLLIRILGPASYGKYATVLTAYEMLKILALLGLNKGLAYRVPRLLEQSQQERAGAFLIRTLIVGLLSAVCLGLLAGVSSQLLADYGQVNLSNWVLGLSPILPLLVVRELLGEWLVSTDRVSEKHVFYTILPRMILLSGLILFWLTNTHAHQLVIALLITMNILPVSAWLIREVRLQFFRELSETALDWVYNLRLLMNDLIRQSLWRIDVLFVYGFLGSTVAGGYKVVTKFARVGKLVDDLTTPVFRPKIGKFFERGSFDSLKHEYDWLRSLSLNSGHLYGLLMAMIGTWILSFFGPYASLHDVLLVLIFGYGVLQSFGNIGNLLVMDGQSGWVLRSSTVGLIVNLALNLILIPILGAKGAAIATALSLIGQNGTAYLGVLESLDLNMMDYLEFTLASLALAMAIFYGPLLPIGLVLFALTTLYVIHVIFRYSRLKMAYREISRVL